ALAARILTGEVASVETFLAVQRAEGAIFAGIYEQGALAGLLAAFPLNAAGRASVEAGVFDAINIDQPLVAWREGEPAAYYGVGFVAASKEAARAVVKSTAALHRELLWATTTYARAVTEAGERALTSLGFRPFLASDGGLLRLDP